MNAVVDANAAIEMALGRPKAEPFRRLLATVDLATAPSLIANEVANALWKHHRFDGVPADTCQQALQRGLGCIDECIPDEELAADALALACHHSHAAYDMFYLALARATGAALLTMDTRLKGYAREYSVPLLDEPTT